MIKYFQWAFALLFVGALLYWAHSAPIPSLDPKLKPETSNPRYLNFTCEENC